MSPVIETKHNNREGDGERGCHCGNSVFLTLHLSQDWGNRMGCNVILQAFTTKWNLVVGDRVEYSQCGVTGQEGLHPAPRRGADRQDRLPV